MQGIRVGLFRNLKTGLYTGFAVLALLLPVLTGCAVGGKEKSQIVHEPEVSKLEDGREGFIITETSEMDRKSRSDFEQAVALLKAQNYDQAIELLKGVIEESPGVTAPYINLAIAYQRIGEREEAEEQLKTALKLFPDHPVACNEYGLLYRQTGRFDEARAIYERAIARFPDFYPAHKNLGILCDLYLNDPACALEHYEIYSKAKPEDAQVKIWIADINNRFGSR